MEGKASKPHASRGARSGENTCTKPMTTVLVYALSTPSEVAVTVSSRWANLVPTVGTHRDPSSENSPAGWVKCTAESSLDAVMTSSPEVVTSRPTQCSRTAYPP